MALPLTPHGPARGTPILCTGEKWRPGPAGHCPCRPPACPTCDRLPAPALTTALRPWLQGEDRGVRGLLSPGTLAAPSGGGRFLGHRHRNKRTPWVASAWPGAVTDQGSRDLSP